MKSRSLNLLESSGPVQACKGIALPFCSNIKLGLKEIGYEGVEWIRLFQYRDKGLPLSDRSNGTSRSLICRECLD
jgi:hypothetical protein